MNKEKRTEVKVGLTVIVGVVLFIWVLGWAKNFSLADNSQRIQVEFNTVSGLNNGDVVTVSGVKKGYVEEIRLVNNRALTILSIDNDIDLYSDATFTVAMLDLMGGKKVEILPGSSGRPLDLGNIHEGLFAGDISSAMAALSSVQSDIVVLIKEVRNAVTKVNDSFLSDKFIGSINTNLADLNKVLRNTNALIENNSEDLSVLIDNSNHLVDKGNQILTDNKDEIESSLSNLKTMLIQSNELLDRLNRFASETEEGRNTLGKIIKDEKLFDDLKSTLINTKDLIRILLKQIEKEGIKVDANIF